MISIIVCYAKNRIIGKDNQLPWHIPEDLKRFKSLTSGHALICGKTTYDSVGKLPNRRMIVIDNSAGGMHELDCGDIITNNAESAIEIASGLDPDPFVIGGAYTYKTLLPVVRRLYLTELKEEYDGDTYFPEIDERAWLEIECEEKSNLIYRTLIRCES